MPLNCSSHSLTRLVYGPPILIANCLPKHRIGLSDQLPHLPFAHCSYIKTASNSSSSMSVLSIIPSVCNYSSIFFGIYAYIWSGYCQLYSCFPILVLCFSIFTHFWPGSPLNQSSIQQIFIESLLNAQALGETSNLLQWTKPTQAFMKRKSYTVNK